MLTSLMAGLVLGGGAPEFADTRITGATVFRNGYGFVVTEAKLSDTGVTYIRSLPQAVEGTLWFAPSGGARISDVTVTWVEDEPIVDTAESIPEILALNIGKTVSIGVSQNMYGAGGFQGVQTETVVGKVVNVTRSGVLLQTETALRSIAFAQIVFLNGKFEDFATIAKTNVKSPVLRVHSDPGTNGSILTVSLVQGLNWVPAYEIELKDGGKMSLTMKATILNALGDFEKVSVGLMSGFPPIDRINERDPLTSALSAIFAASKDANRLAMVKGMQAYAGGFQAGGYGGGGGVGGAGPEDKFTGYFASPGAQEDARKSAAFDELNRNFASSEQENFFIYGVPLFELKRNERKYLVIDDGELNYVMVHKMSSTSQLADVGVARFLTFDNGLKVPLTRASAIIVRGGELVGKVSVPYTYMGDKVELALGDAPYVKARSETAVLKINRAKLKLRDGRIFDEIVKRDTVTVRNLSSRASEIELTHSLRGDTVTHTPKADEAKLSTQDSVNFDYRLKWSQSIAPGATQTFTVEYSFFQFVR